MKKESIREETKRQFRENFKIEWSDILYKNIPVLLLIYSVLKKYPILFNEDNTLYLKGVLPNDPLLIRLLGIAKDNPWMKDTYYALKQSIGYQEEKEILAVEKVVGCIIGQPLEKLVGGTNDEMIARALNNLGVKSVRITRPGWIELACDNRFTGDIMYSPISHDNNTDALSIIAEIIRAFECSNSLPVFEHKQCDAVVVKYNGVFDSSFPELVNEAGVHSERYIIMEINGLDNVDGFEDGGRLVQVYHDSIWTENYLFIFDMEQTHDCFEYHLITNRKETVRNVPYSEIEENDGFYQAELYFYPELEAGTKYIRLNEICKVCDGYEYTIDSSKEAESIPVPVYQMSRKLDTVCKSPYHHKLQDNQRFVWCPPGTCLFIEDRGIGLEECITRTEGPFGLDGDPTSLLLVDEKIISPEYLALVLSKDKGLKQILWYWKHLEWSGFMLLPLYKIPVTLDREEQDRIVREELDKYHEVVNSEGVYNVVCVGNSISSHEITDRLKEWNLTVDTTDSVFGDGGLMSRISNNKSSSRIDAIIIDPMTDSTGVFLNGLKRALTLVEKDESIPVYIYSELAAEDLKKALDEIEYEYCTKGHIFDATANSGLCDLVTSLRNELDHSGALDVQIRALYAKEFTAADKVQKMFGIDVPSKLMDVMLSPNQNISLLRESLEGLLKTIAANIAPDTNLKRAKGGWLVKFFRRGGEFSDFDVTKKTYTLNKKLMENTLAESVEYLYKILNGASHSESDERGNELNVLNYIKDTGTKNLALAAIHIYMDFIVWLASTDGRFDGIICTEQELAPDYRYKKSVG